MLVACIIMIHDGINNFLSHFFRTGIWHTHGSVKFTWIHGDVVYFLYRHQAVLGLDIFGFWFQTFLNVSVINIFSLISMWWNSSPWIYHWKWNYWWVQKYMLLTYYSLPIFLAVGIHLGCIESQMCMVLDPSAEDAQYWHLHGRKSFSHIVRWHFEIDWELLLEWPLWVPTVTELRCELSMHRWFEVNTHVWFELNLETITGLVICAFRFLFSAGITFDVHA